MELTSLLQHFAETAVVPLCDHGSNYGCAELVLSIGCAI
jgi:hypothetical protein